MDSHAFFTVWILTAIGLCLCQDRAVGEDVEFRLINPPPAPPFQINWIFEGSLICSASAGSVIGVNPSYEGKASLDPNTATLELRNLTVNDTGEYTLRVTMIIGQPETEWKTTLRVFERVSDPAITIAGSPDPLIAGKSSVSLTCEAKGSNITRKWMKNGETLSPESGRITFSDDNRTVSISPVQKEDRGEYKCQVSNPVSNAEGSETLIVNYGPEKVEIKGEGHEGAVEFGQKIHLSCSAESVPDCTYTWTLNGTDEIGTGASFIKENSVYEDSGNYTCTAFNNITKETNKTDLELSVKAPVFAGQGGLSIWAIVGIVVAAIVIITGISVFVVKRKGLSLSRPFSGGTSQKVQVPPDIPPGPTANAKNSNPVYENESNIRRHTDTTHESSSFTNAEQTDEIYDTTILKPV